MLTNWQAINPIAVPHPSVQITGSDLPFITNHRRIREHRKMTLVLNLLLAGRTSCLIQRHDHLWAIVFPDEVKWVREGYYAPLDHHVLNEQRSSIAPRSGSTHPAASGRFQPLPPSQLTCQQSRR
jgi:hypothetical protein